MTLRTTVACVLLSFASIAPSLAQAAVKHTIDIPQQQLGSALTELAKQTHIQVVYTTDLVEGRSTRALRGSMTPEEALNQLLDETGLRFEFLDAQTVTLSRASADGKTGTVTPAHAPSGVTRSTVPPAADTTKGDQKRSFWDRFRLAQADRPGDSQTSAVADAEQGSREPIRVEEVIVTATRRPASIQDVPLSIAAVSADDIDRRGLSSAADYLRGIPGVNQSDGIFGQSIVIRGIETSPHLQNFFSGTTTATYFGETPTTNTAGLGGGTNVDVKVVDVERVEVLRGPQGTAFGSSSMGGAVRTIPVAPHLDRFEGKAAAAYSRTSGTGGDDYNVQAVVNVPLVTDALGVRVVGYKYEDSGFYRNRAASSSAFQTAVVNPFGAQAFAKDENEVGSTSIQGGRIALAYQATDDLKFTLTHLTQKNETDGVGVSTSGTYDETILQVAPQHVVRGETGGAFDADLHLTNGAMEYGLGWGDLLATYSYIDSGSVQAYPFGAVGINVPVSSTAFSDHHEHVGEVRLTTKLQGPWNFVVGLYAEKLDDQALFDNLWHGNPATNIFGTTTALGTRRDNRTLKQNAAYGEASWEFLPGLTFTGGVRAYKYDRTFQVVASGALYGPIDMREDADASGENYRANLSYKVNPNTLLYAGWSQGFRLGQNQLGLPVASCDIDGNGVVDGTNIPIDSTRRVNSDNVDSYELGAKFAALDGRLTVAADAFHMNWADMPVQVRPGTGTCITGYVANAGESRSDGVEFQANYRILEPLRLDLGGAYINARLTQDVPALGAKEGNRLVSAPRVTANLGLEYRFGFGGHAFSARVDSIYVGSYFNDLVETARLEAGDYVKVDASARMEVGALSVDLFVRNLTNEDAFTYRGIRPTVGPFYGYRMRPRTVGLQLGYTF